MAKGPKRYPPASLATLPSEIIAEIIGLLLPKGVCTGTFALSYPYPDHPWKGDVTRPGWEKDPDQNRWAILYTSQHFHAEVVRFLHAKTFCLYIDEYSVCWASVAKLPIIAGERAKLEKPYQFAPLDVELTKCRPFRGLKLSQVSELMIEIQPSDLGTFWSSLGETLCALCDGHLLSRGPIKNLIIQLQDMWSSDLWVDIPWDAENSLEYIPEGTVVFEDYEHALKSFRRVVAMAGRCEIRLPHWMERYPSKERLSKTWSELGAQVVFQPCPYGSATRAEEANERDRGDFVPLPKKCLLPEKPVEVET